MKKVRKIRRLWDCACVCVSERESGQENEKEKAGKEKIKRLRDTTDGKMSG